MSGRWLLMGVFCLVMASIARAEPETMTEKARASLEARAKRYDEECVQLYRQGKPTEALARAQQVLVMRQKLYPTNQFPQGHADLAKSLNTIGFLLRSLDRFEEAMDHFQQALVINQKLYPEKQFPQGKPQLALSLNNMGGILESVGRPDEALEYYHKALAMQRKLYPPKDFPDGHVNIAISLHNIGSVCQRSNRLGESLEYFQQTLAMYQTLYPKKQFPKGHPDLASTLNNLAGVFHLLGRLESAAENYQIALAMLQDLYPIKDFPHGHSILATTLNNMGSILQSLGQLQEALQYYQQNLAMNQKLYPEKQFPKGHANLVRSLNSMGSILKSLGQLESALKYYQESLAMCQKLYPVEQFPKGHGNLATSLNNMGSVLLSLGRLEKALEYHKKALTMRQSLYPIKHFPHGQLNLANSLNNMGSVLLSLGQMQEGLKYHQQALAMKRKLYPGKQFPQGHKELVDSLENMGFGLHRLGRLEEALEHFHQALTICGKLYPENQFPQGHKDLATGLNNMGGVLQSLGRREEALEHFKQALVMYRKLYPKKQFPQGHTDLARGMNNVGSVFEEMGQLETALNLYRQSLAMRQQLYPEKQFPTGHKDLASSLNGIGLVSQKLGRQEEALESFQKALAMNRKLYPEKQFPQGHAELAGSLNNVGAGLLAAQRPREAMVMLEQALAMQRGLADRFAMASSESEALAFNRAALSSFNTYLSAARHLPQSTPATYGRVWIDRASLNRLLLRRHQAALVLASDNSEIRKRFDRLQTTRRDLARLLLQPLPTDPESLQVRDSRVNELTDSKQDLEREIARLLSDFDRQRWLDTLGPDDLRKALPANAVFIDVLRYFRVEVDPKKLEHTGVSSIPHYVAFVVRADAEVQRVELGEAKPIEEALADFLHLIDGRQEQNRPQPAATLRRLVWDPLAEKMPRETNTIYLTPDGDLTRLPWAALPGSKKDTILLEDYALALVPHGPFLLEQLRSERRFGQGKGTPLVLAGVRYSDIAAIGPDALAMGGHDGEGTKENWAYLQGTERELKLVLELAGKDTLALAGKDASVPRLLSALPQARLAHMATHGFFNQKEYRLEKERAKNQATELLRSPEIMLGPAVGRITAGAQNPLAYTGLVLAGANVPEKAGPSGGILTGESIVDLDLRRMELAVLSACQTGLGEAENGECVHNLQIAFHVAGCANVAASLWNVPDESTAALMGLFYRNLLVEGKTPLEALRSAQLYLYRHPGQIKELAERGPPLVAKGTKIPEPAAKPDPQVQPEGKRAAVKDWAAFVLSGVGR